MSVKDISIPLQYIRSSILSEMPVSGQFNGQIFYATDVNLSFVWDGTEWLETSIDIDDVYKFVGQNGLNILDLTAQMNLTAGINANFIRDIYTDANGYLNTINTSNTTAFFINKLYRGSFSQISNPIFSGSADTNKWSGFKFTPNVDLKIRDIVFRNNADMYRIRDESGNILGTTIEEIKNYTYLKNTLYKIECKPSSGYVNAIDGSLTPNFSAILISSFAGILEGSSDSNNKTRSIQSIEIETIEQNGIVETNLVLLELEPSNFMIIANTETTGTGNVTYDITFDGTNYQENCEANVKYQVTNTGTNMKLKQKLNKGEGDGIASAQNYGVLIW